MDAAELKYSWEDNCKPGQTVRANLNSGEKLTVNAYRLGKKSVTFLLDGEVVVRTPISNVWYFI